MNKNKSAHSHVTLSKSVLCAFVFLFLPAQPSYSHELEQSYIFLTVSDDSLAGRIEINIPDLNLILGSTIPTDGNAAITDIDPYLDDIRNYLQSRVGFALEGMSSKSLPLTDYEVSQVEIAQYFIYHFEFSDLITEPKFVDVDYAVLFDEHPNHRAMLVIETNWKSGTFENEAQISMTFSGDNISQRLDLSDSSVWRGFVELVRLGIHHIWIGIDHILFLMALLLPSALRRESGQWQPVVGFRAALMYVVKVVTVFTVAHTITLSLAALNAVSLPSRLVESIIALSIAIAAVENLYPVFRGRIWVIVFVFGLFHGFGFATVLGEIGIPPKYMVHSLLGFNIGVELGQLAIVCVVFPVLYVMRNWWMYPKFLLKYGSLAMITVSLYWFVERGLEIDLPAGAMLNWVIDRVT